MPVVKAKTYMDRFAGVEQYEKFNELTRFNV
jgi:hypothetical protein